jgi:hypothetical protein
VRFETITNRYVPGVLPGKWRILLDPNLRINTEFYMICGGDPPSAARSSLKIENFIPNATQTNSIVFICGWMHLHPRHDSIFPHDEIGICP